jgi:hypothetical protein
MSNASHFWLFRDISKIVKPVVRKIQSGSHLTEMLALICSASLRWKTQEGSPAWQKTLLSQTDRMPS